MVISSPADRVPDSMRPAMMRRSSNLYTSWMGNRRARCSRPFSFSMESMASRAVIPCHQGSLSLGWVMFWPSKAEMGM